MRNILDLITSKEVVTHGNFTDVFERNVRNGHGYRGAYESTENDYQERNGERRYKNFDSFRQSFYSKSRRKKR